MLQARARWFYFAIACVSLGIGYVVYFLGRPGPAIYAIPSSIEQWIVVQPLVAEISGQLPSFFHTYAFILLTFIVLGTSSRFNLYLSISLWATVEVLFEAGQHHLFQSSIINLIPDWFDQIRALDLTHNYFLQGTFDPLDLLAIAIGSACALLTVHLFQREEIHHA